MRPRARTLPALVGYIAIAVALSAPVWTSPAHRYIGTGTDPYQTAWFLGWIPHAIATGHNPLFTDYLNGPLGVNLMWNIALPLLAVVLWPVTALWGPLVSYNVIITSGQALAAFCCFLAMRRLVPGYLPALVAGLIYGFSPLVIAQSLGHAHIVFSALSAPLLLLLIDELIHRQRWPWWLTGALLGLLAAAQLLVSEEILLTDTGAAVLLLGLCAVAWRRQAAARLGYAARALGTACLIAALLLAYPLWFQFLGPARLHGSIHDTTEFSTDLLNFLVPTAIQAVAPAAATSISGTFTGNLWESDGYLGIPLLLLIVIVVVRRRSPMAGVAFGLMLITMLLALGPQLHIAGHLTRVPLPERVVAGAPLLRNIIPERLMLHAFLAAALLVALGLRQLWEWRPNWLLQIVACACFLVPLAPAAPLRWDRVSVPSFFTSPALDRIAPGAVVMSVPWPTSATAQPMLWQIASGYRFRLLGGYVLAPVPGGQEALSQLASILSAGSAGTALTVAQQDSVLTQLRRANVRAVLLDVAEASSRAPATLSALLRSTPSSAGGIDMWLLPSGL